MKILERRRSHHSMKRFYNWFYQFYGFIENGLSANVDGVVEHLFAEKEKYKDQTAIEYACGSGLLGRKLSKIFKTVDGRDSSINMLQRAKQLAGDEGANIHFEEGNVLEIQEPDKSYDYVFMSFALHLFSADDIRSILTRLLKVARKEVIIIDHSLKWGPVSALIEWIEGSYYDQFIKMDFKRLAQSVGAGHFSMESISDCSVMRLAK